MTQAAPPEPNSKWHTFGSKGIKVKVIVIRVDGRDVTFRNLRGKYFYLPLERFLEQYSRGH